MYVQLHAVDWTVDTGIRSRRRPIHED